MIKDNRKLTVASYLILGFAILFTLTAIFWLVYPYKIADIKEPIPVLNENKEIKHGEHILLRLVLDKYANIPPKETSIFLTRNDGNLVPFTPMPGSVRPVGHYEYTVSNFRLPESAYVGSKCVFNFKLVYPVNPIRNVVKDWSSEEFTVIE